MSVGWLTCQVNRLARFVSRVNMHNAGYEEVSNKFYVALFHWIKHLINLWVVYAHWYTLSSSLSHTHADFSGSPASSVLFLSLSTDPVLV